MQCKPCNKQTKAVNIQDVPMPFLSWYAEKNIRNTWESEEEKEKSNFVRRRLDLGKTHNFCYTSLFLLHNGHNKDISSGRVRSVPFSFGLCESSAQLVIWFGIVETFFNRSDRRPPAAKKVHVTRLDQEKIWKSCHWRPRTDSDCLGNNAIQFRGFCLDVAPVIRSLDLVLCLQFNFWQNFSTWEDN